MLNLFKSILFVFLSSFFVGFFYSCANIGTITGGDRDSIPPVMVGSYPLIADTGYKEEKLMIFFNEYFALKDINQEFYSSPPFGKIPDFKIKKSGLLVKFNEALKDSVTYTLYFGKAIADYNESNVLKNLRFHFSTYSRVDSFSVSGNLRNAFDQSAPEKSMVMLFENNQDSVPYLELPTYLCKTDSSGNFSIDFIKQGAYKIFAYNDKNNNQLTDFFEERAFLDSLIIPDRKTSFTIDSIKAGTILHDTISNITDSLETDTTIVNRIYTNKPSNLQLYLFAEDNQIQKLIDYSRKEKEKINIVFAIPVKSDLNIKPFDFEILPENVILEKNHTNDSISWWITDKSVYERDTLQLSVSYLSKDSTGNPTTIIDTLLLEYREKQSSDAWKRKQTDKVEIKQEYLNLNFLAKEKKVDLNKPLRIESQQPLLNVDTSLIKLFEIIDTLVVDTKEQGILKAFRLKKDMLTFSFKRPVARDFSLLPMNFTAENWYTAFPNDSNRTYVCKITKQEIAQLDTLKLKVEFDNYFFMDQIQVLTDTAIFPISAQKIISRKRPEADKIILIFDKPLTSNLSVSPSDFTAIPNWYRLSANSTKDTITLSITDKNVINKDTLTLAIKCFDYVGLKDDSAYFTETMRLTFKEKEQFMVSAGRIKNDELKMVFNKKISENPVIEPINFTLNTNWYKIEKNKEADTITLKISDELVLSMDTLNLLLKYKDINRKGNSFEYIDTIFVQGIRLVQYKQKTESAAPAKAGNEAKTVHIYLPEDYKIEQDTLNIRQKLLIKKWKEDTKYLLRLDSMSFTNVYKVYNKAQDYEFSSPALDYYSSIQLKLKNIKPDLIAMANDTSKIDTLENKKELAPAITIKQKDVDELIGQGKIILQLVDEKGNVLKEFFISEDQQVKMDFLSPANYKLKIIFDRNGNGKWDTGKYFKHEQPERVIINGEVLSVKSAMEFELDWNVGESLIKSFTKEIDIETEIVEDAEFEMTD